MAGIVLSGGQSQRMGRDKATLLYEGVPLLDRVVGILGAVTPGVIVVTASEECYAPLGAYVVYDEYPGAGPLGGLVTGLKAAGRGAHIVVACDMPLLQPELLRLLLERLGSADAAVPRIAGQPEPLCAVYSATSVPALEAAVAEGELAVHKALDRIRVRYVEEEELRSVDPELISFTNLNQPEDLARLAGDEGRLTHLDERGQARMVDVGDKEETRRSAVAAGSVRMSPETLSLLRAGALPKGDALAVARVAGIQAAKRTSELIPLCHPLPITSAEVRLLIAEDCVEIEAEVAVLGRTGVEMEALTAVAIAGLTLYDMVKSVDRSARITDIRLLKKTGGKSGDYQGE